MRIGFYATLRKIVGEKYVVPKSYDPNENIFYTYGHFDSLPCAKAFLLEQSSFDHGHQANVFSKMVREVYGIQEEIAEAVEFMCGPGAAYMVGSEVTLDGGKAEL